MDSEADLVRRCQMGDGAAFATHRAPDWPLDGVARMRVARPAAVDGLEGVKVEVEEWDGDVEGWRDAGWSMCARENGAEIQYLAVIGQQGKGISINTYLSQGFTGAWGCMKRRIEDTGRYVRQPDGSWKQAHSADNFDACGAGMYEVRIGEAYITAEGRTVLIRDYAHDCFDNIDLDRSHALVIDGQTLYHWTDRVTEAGLGL